MFTDRGLSWPAFWCGGSILIYQFSKRIILTLSLLLGLPILAQDDSALPWNGDWIAEGTLFSIGVSVRNNKVIVEQIESLGFEWTSTNGKLADNLVTVQVEYAGVTGIILAELIDDNTALVSPQSCTPEFMVVCVLAKNQQVIFRKVQPQ
ncbi:MAG: hypothetical protein QGG67_18765 [Gammaproteobacteria bacterium]|nr:hypothetical protein [Gammaproteobacteria bacterium]